MRSERRVHGVPSLVPHSWKLIRKNAQGQESVLASHVASFTIARDGQVLFSNGGGIFQLDGNNRAQLVLRDKIIGEVITPR